ncbi:MAG: SdpI family protein [Ignavibacteriaceae bacterium]|jgi:uncharacterized membrane protein
MKNPIKYSFKTEIWLFIIILAAVCLSIWSFQYLPERMITHWNLAGKADGWSSREFTVIFFPSFLAAIYAILTISPRFDPKRERYQEFSRVYFILRAVVLLLILIAFAIIIFSNLGYKIDIGTTLTIVMSIVIIIMGKVKPNWFLGIRTPWTLSSENVWNKTHRLFSRLWVCVGICALIVVWINPAAAIIIFSAGVAGSFIYVCVYSYILYKNEKKEYKV